MKRIRGFLLKHRVTALFRCICRANRPTSGYNRLDPSPKCKKQYMRKLFNWGNHLKAKAIAICSKNGGSGSLSGYSPIGHEPIREKPFPVPKGKMAVYVGEKDSEFRRVLVPVIYFNHPLFGQLLREAEEEYGHNHPGGITIPCQISEFEKVKTRIAAGCGGQKMLTWKRHV